MSGDEGLLFLDDLIHTVVGVEVGLDVAEDNHGSVGASSTKETSINTCNRRYFCIACTNPLEPMPIASWKVLA